MINVVNLQVKQQNIYDRKPVVSEASGDPSKANTYAEKAGKMKDKRESFVRGILKDYVNRPRSSSSSNESDQTSDKSKLYVMINP